MVEAVRHCGWFYCI